LLPKRQRRYFSVPETEKALKQELEKRHLVHLPPLQQEALLTGLGRHEVQRVRPTPISSDAEPPVIPSRHVIGGSMLDHEGEHVPWNNRHGQGIGVMNDGMHHLHRQYFSEPSLFATAPSQRWRRYADIEVNRGIWQPIKERPKFGAEKRS
jgi:hypothetical protein